MNGKAKARATAWQTAKRVPVGEEDRFLKDIEEVGKGRYAQRLASTMKKTINSRPNGPKYILDALTYLSEQCRSR